MLDKGFEVYSQEMKKERGQEEREIISNMLILVLKECKFYCYENEEEGKIPSRLQVVEMNGNIWESSRR